MQISSSPKLFMVLLGSKAPQRNVEQHDFFFGIADTLGDLIPQMRTFWPEAGSSLHIDGWREVNVVDGYGVRVRPRLPETIHELDDLEFDQADPLKLFFVNLGGYQRNKLEEQHYTILSVNSDRAAAVQHAKKTVFFKNNSIKGANAHIDEKYGIDVDDVYRVDDILSPQLKQQYRIEVYRAEALQDDAVHLGYFRLDKLSKSL